LKEIEGQAGLLLDAEAVKVCADLFRNNKLVLSGLNRL